MKKTKAFYALGAAAFFFLTSYTAVAQNKPQLTDPEIASVAVTANQVDIDYAKIAEAKSQNADVKTFAQTMAKDHQSVIDQAVALVKKLNVTPKDNAVSKKLNADAAKERKALNAKSGSDFDKAYINNEVSYHKAVISTVENVLIPESQNAELKGLLQKVLPVLKTHLEHAEMVQKKIVK
jgi:putative membrane protein